MMIARMRKESRGDAENWRERRKRHTRLPARTQRTRTHACTHACVRRRSAEFARVQRRRRYLERNCISHSRTREARNCLSSPRLAHTHARARAYVQEEAMIGHCTNLSEATHTPLDISLGVVLPKSAVARVFSLRGHTAITKLFTLSLSSSLRSFSLALPAPFPSLFFVLSRALSFSLDLPR